jgi:hypothetical protein
LGKPSRLVVVDCVRAIPFGLVEFCIDPGAAVYLALASPPSEVAAMVRDVARQYHLSIEAQEIVGASAAAIVHVVRGENANVVILPGLGHEAGAFTRWIRRSLISRIAAKTQAIVTDEHGLSAVPAPA